MLVLVAYFEELDRFESAAADDPDMPHNVRTVMRRAGRQRLRKPRPGQRGHGESGRHSGKLGSLVRGLLHDELPVPVPQCPYEVTLERLRELYGRLSAQLAVQVVGPESWDTLHPDDRKAFRDEPFKKLSAGARRSVMRSCSGAWRPNFPKWPSGRTSLIIRRPAVRYRDLRAGLAGVEHVLACITTARAADERRDALARSYHAALDQSECWRQVKYRQKACGSPRSGEAYINPDFRVAEVGLRDSPHLEQWWDDHPVRDDFQGFLLGYLTSPQATTSPLVLLGQPGCGEVGPDQGPSRSPSGE